MTTALYGLDRGAARATEWWASTRWNQRKTTYSYTASVFPIYSVFGNKYDIGSSKISGKDACASIPTRPLLSVDARGRIRSVHPPRAIRSRGWLSPSCATLRVAKTPIDTHDGGIYLL
jgi:hypothetical protein